MPNPVTFYCEILGNCLGLSELKLFLIMFLIMILAPWGGLSAQITALKLSE